MRPWRLCAVSRGEGAIALSWGLLQDDAQDVRFNVYRASDRNHGGQRITQAPLQGTTFLADSGLAPGRRYQYYVRPVDATGRVWLERAYHDETLESDYPVPADGDPYADTNESHARRGAKV